MSGRGGGRPDTCAQVEAQVINSAIWKSHKDSSQVRASAGLQIHPQGQLIFLCPGIGKGLYCCCVHLDSRSTAECNVEQAPSKALRYKTDSAWHFAQTCDGAYRPCGTASRNCPLQGGEGTSQRNAACVFYPLTTYLGNCTCRFLLVMGG